MEEIKKKVLIQHNKWTENRLTGKPKRPLQFLTTRRCRRIGLSSVEEHLQRNLWRASFTWCSEAFWRPVENGYMKLLSQMKVKRWQVFVIRSTLPFFLRNQYNFDNNKRKKVSFLLWQWTLTFVFFSACFFFFLHFSAKRGTTQTKLSSFS